LVQPNWTAKDEERKIALQRDTGIFVNPRKSENHEDEYPYTSQL